MPGTQGTFERLRGSLPRLTDILCQNVFPLFVKNQASALQHPFLMTPRRVGSLLVQLCLPLCRVGQALCGALWVGEGTTAVRIIVTGMTVASKSY